MKALSTILKSTNSGMSAYAYSKYYCDSIDIYGVEIADFALVYVDYKRLKDIIDKLPYHDENDGVRFNLLKSITYDIKQIIVNYMLYVLNCKVDFSDIEQRVKQIIKPNINIREIEIQKLSDSKVIVNITFRTVQKQQYLKPKTVMVSVWLKPK